jgi:hypothetical protein
LKKPMLFRRVRTLRLSRKISHRGFPRLFMLLLIMLAASLGLLASAWMLRHGWHNMGLRYGLACLVAYGGFLLMLSVWLWLLRRARPAQGAGRDRGGGLRGRTVRVRRAAGAGWAQPPQ